MDLPAWVRNQEAWRANCRKLAAAAQRLANGSVSVLEGARAIIDASNSLRSPYQVAYGLPPDCESELSTFREIERLGINFPSGSGRQYWSASALELVDGDIERLENQWRDRAISAAQHLVAVFTNV